LLEGAGIGRPAVSEVLHGCTVAPMRSSRQRRPNRADHDRRVATCSNARIRVPRLYEPLYPSRTAGPAQTQVEVAERMGRMRRAAGARQGFVTGAIATLRAEQVEAVAVCFLHSYANPAHELEAGGRCATRCRTLSLRGR